MGCLRGAVRGCQASGRCVGAACWNGALRRRAGSSGATVLRGTQAQSQAVRRRAGRRAETLTHLACGDGASRLFGPVSVFADGMHTRQLCRALEEKPRAGM